MTNVTTEGEEPLRLERLRDVEAELGRDICGKILRLHDHKGVLYVDWAERPSPQDIMTVIQKWGRHEKEPVTTMRWVSSWSVPQQDTTRSVAPTIFTARPSNIYEPHAIF